MCPLPSSPTLDFGWMKEGSVCHWVVPLSGSLRLGVAWSHHLWSLILICLMCFPPNASTPVAWLAGAPHHLPSLGTPLPDVVCGFSLSCYLMSRDYSTQVYSREVTNVQTGNNLCQFKIFNLINFLVSHDLLARLHRKFRWLIFILFYI